MGGRKKRKGAAAVSRQLNDYWKASFGATYLELSNPLASASGKSGYDGSRLDAGARLEYAPDADHTYYGFAQATLSRSGDIERGDRLGLGTEYRLTATVGLEGEVSYGATGLGALAAITYEPTAEDSYYLGYRLDPDRAFDLDRSYDLEGTDYGAIVIGARRKLDDYWSTYAENNYDLFGRRNSLAQTYGVVYSGRSMAALRSEPSRTTRSTLAPTSNGPTSTGRQSRCQWATRMRIALPRASAARPASKIPTMIRAISTAIFWQRASAGRRATIGGCLPISIPFSPTTQAATARCAMATMSRPRWAMPTALSQTTG
ncbi:MAG: hypothetical protein AAAB35_27275 [Phyllobacterium sp.]|uniref:hypothetical protein n=1 Tax=Phyllobacterium sp. TaxID=1871046 RepID=UPI0030F357EA